MEREETDPRDRNRLPSTFYQNRGDYFTIVEGLFILFFSKPSELTVSFILRNNEAMVIPNFDNFYSFLKLEFFFLHVDLQKDVILSHNKFCLVNDIINKE